MFLQVCVGLDQVVHHIAKAQTVKDPEPAKGVEAEIPDLQEFYEYMEKTRSEKVRASRLYAGIFGAREFNEAERAQQRSRREAILTGGK